MKLHTQRRKGKVGPIKAHNLRQRMTFCFHEHQQRHSYWIQRSRRLLTEDRTPTFISGTWKYCERIPEPPIKWCKRRQKKVTLYLNYTALRWLLMNRVFAAWHRTRCSVFSEVLICRNQTNAVLSFWSKPFWPQLVSRGECGINGSDLNRQSTNYPLIYNQCFESSV